MTTIIESVIVRESRGVILDSANNWSVVALPFDKFFNYGELDGVYLLIHLNAHPLSMSVYVYHR
jgi:tRNA splicing ligase